MSYTPTEWKTGDVITAEKLNNMESGILGSAKVVLLNVNTETRTLNKTWNEIKNAMLDGALCLVLFSVEGATNIALITGAVQTPEVENQYCVYFNFETPQTAEVIGIATTPDGYPALSGR